MWMPRGQGGASTKEATDELGQQDPGRDGSKLDGPSAWSLEGVGQGHLVSSGTTPRPFSSYGMSPELTQPTPGMGAFQAQPGTS